MWPFLNSRCLFSFFPGTFKALLLFKIYQERNSYLQLDYSL